jgi:hypothetical protein
MHNTGFEWGGARPCSLWIVSEQKIRNGVGVCEVQGDAGNVGRLVKAKYALALIHDANGQARVRTQLQLNLAGYPISGVDKTTLFAGSVVQRDLARCDQGENRSPRQTGQMAAQKAIETAAVFGCRNDPLLVLGRMLGIVHSNGSSVTDLSLPERIISSNRYSVVREMGFYPALYLAEKLAK